MPGVRSRNRSRYTITAPKKSTSAATLCVDKHRNVRQYPRQDSNTRGLALRKSPTHTRALHFLPAFVLLLAQSTAAAQEGPEIDVTTTTTIEYHIDNENGKADDDDYGVVINRTNLATFADGLTATLRLDGSLFLNEYKPDPPAPPHSPYQDDTRVERLTVEYDFGDYQLTAGDFYQQLGRGIALSVRKVNELAIDTAIRGGKLQWSGDEHTLNAFAGRINTANMDNISQKFVQDPEDILAGSHFEYNGLDLLTPGIYAFYFQPQEPILKGNRDHTETVGGYLDISGLTDWLSLYVEADFQQRTLAGADPETGTALYIDSSATFGDTVLFVELMQLKKYELRGSSNTALDNRFSYNQAPTLERIDQEVLNNRDVEGGRLRIEQTIPDTQFQLYANAMVRNIGEPPENGLEDARILQTHYFGGFDWIYQDGSSRLGMSLGWRDEVQQDNSIKTILSPVLDYVQHLGGRYALHVMSWNEFRTLEERSFRRGSTFLGLEATQLGSITFEYGFDTQNPSDEIAKHFFAGILAWHASEDLDIRTTLGTQRGGLKCIAGVCREFPGFAGARAEIIGRF